MRRIWRQLVCRLMGHDWDYPQLHAVPGDTPLYCTLVVCRRCGQKEEHLMVCSRRTTAD